VKADLLVWTAGSRPSPLLDSLDVRRDPRGRVEVDRRLRLAVPGGVDGGAGGHAHGGVYCLGDIAAVEGLDLGCNAQVRLLLLLLLLL